MLILRLSKREDQALILISTILKFSALYSTFLAYVMERYREEKIQMSSSFSLNYKLLQGIFFSTENYKKEFVSWNILLI